MRFAKQNRWGVCARVVCCSIGILVCFAYALCLKSNCRVHAHLKTAQCFTCAGVPCVTHGAIYMHKRAHNIAASDFLSILPQGGVWCRQSPMRRHAHAHHNRIYGLKDVAETGRSWGAGGIGACCEPGNFWCWCRATGAGAGATASTVDTPALTPLHSTLTLETCSFTRRSL